MEYITHITTIVPRLPPAIDGVGDYGLHLAKQMRQDFGLITEFIVADPSWSGEAFVEGFPIKRVTKQSVQDLGKLLPKELNSRSIILLHYVGYGYAKRGCPIWLVRGLENWVRNTTDPHLVTMFHELYAFGSIWTSQFWTSPLQRNLAARLVLLSDRCLTSKQEYGEIIRKFSRGKHAEIPTLPVFSTVGEPDNLTPLAERQRRLVVFGGCGSRSRVYQRSHSALTRTCQELEITEILDIGPTLNFKVEPINNIPIVLMGILSPEEISHLFANSIVGFFDYHTEYLAKSTIYAAYSAHKLLPVGVWYEANCVDGLQVDVHYLLGDRYPQKMNLSAAQIIADNAYAWYNKHKLSIQASSFLNFLTS